MSEPLVLTVTKNEITQCWATGMTLEEILPLCPDNPLVKSFVTTIFVTLEAQMIKPNPEDFLKRLQ
jgi:hypothetical protein